MKDELVYALPILVLAGLFVLVIFGIGLYYHDLATRCIAAGMQWISSACVR